MPSPCAAVSRLRALLTTGLAAVVLAGSAHADNLPELDELLDTPLSELLERDVSLPSGIEERILDAPAATVVVTADDIRRRGYTDLSEVIADLPGFDVIVANGTSYVFAYQRGYRTPFTQRTLLMIDGHVDNHLWTHEAVISRQYPVSNIERVEVLYGPASAVYGPNAFLGIINVVTRDGGDVADGEMATTIDLIAGQHGTAAVDGALRGRVGDLTYAAAARVFRSDEPDLSGRFGYLEPAQFADDAVWGPILDLQQRDEPLGRYADPTDDFGVSGSASYRGARVEWLAWERKEGYGPYYAADRVQNNAMWNKSGSRLAVSVDREMAPAVISRSSLSYRTSRVWGTWIEAEPDGQDSSWVSAALWNSVNDSWLFEQQFEWRGERATITGGLKHERKELTKAYDIPGYWDAFSSTTSDPGPYGLGAAIGHSRDEVYVAPPPPSAEMPPSNLALTRDLGGFVQGIWDAAPFRVTGGLRVDHNSIYGRSVNPRVSLVYKPRPRWALKVLYGEAFQEPPPIQLWGGWSGRLSNPDLAPEKGRTGEVVAMVQTGRALHDASVYVARYEDVIKEEAENAGSRDVWGVEYRGTYSLPNPLGVADLRAQVNYTFTHVTSSLRYDQEAGAWVADDTELGDIAPHKANAIVNVPLRAGWNVNLRANAVGRRHLYSRNPLRAQGRTVDPYVLLHTAVTRRWRGVAATVKVSNLLDSEVFHPGVEQADSGDDFTRRSLGFRNSLIPQPGRTVSVRVTLDL